MTARVRAVGIAVVLVGAWGALIPFVGPLFGYRMGNVTAWTWSESHATLHLVPGVVALVGGVLMLGAARGRARLGAVLALLGGAWFILGPTFHPAWASGDGMASGGGMMMMGGGVWNGIASALGYHYGTGVVIGALGAYALGVLANVTPVAARGVTAVPSSAGAAEPTDQEYARVG